MTVLTGEDGGGPASVRLASLGRLAGGVAHDFNNILGVILNYGEFVREALTSAAADGRLDRAVYRDVVVDLDRISSAAHRAAGLTQQLLAFSGRRVAQAVPMDLNHAVREAQELQRRAFDPRVQTVTRLQPVLPAVLADPTQVAQVLLNLTRNAAEAMPDGGVITIGTDDRADGYVALTVTDSGVGMTPAVLEHAVEPFFTTKPLGQGSGLGLGLAAVHGIARQSGGDLRIESTPGAGTRVTVYLPAAAHPLAALPAAVPAPPGGAESADLVPFRQAAWHETLLVVDDEEELCEATARMLRAAGYQVLTAVGPAPALACSAGYPGSIDLLLTDVRMPGMPGGELAARLRASRPGLRVMYMSGYVDSHADPDGADLLPKPFDRAELLAAVRGVLDRARSVVD